MQFLGLMTYVVEIVLVRVVTDIRCDEVLLRASRTRQYAYAECATHEGHRMR